MELNIFNSFWNKDIYCAKWEYIHFRWNKNFIINIGSINFLCLTNNVCINIISKYGNGFIHIKKSIKSVYNLEAIYIQVFLMYFYFSVLMAYSGFQMHERNIMIKTFNGLKGMIFSSWNIMIAVWPRFTNISCYVAKPARRFSSRCGRFRYFCLHFCLLKWLTLCMACIRKCIHTIR